MCNSRLEKLTLRYQQIIQQLIEFADAAIRYLVEKVLSAKIDGGVRDSIRLREASLDREKSRCCK